MSCGLIEKEKKNVLYQRLECALSAAQVQSNTGKDPVAKKLKA